MLLCIEDYSDPERGSFDKGQVYNTSPEVEALLLKKTKGAFVVAGTDEAATAQAGFEAEAQAEEERKAAELEAAMSTETASGLVVPDRRARGGRKRGK